MLQTSIICLHSKKSNFTAESPSNGQISSLFFLSFLKFNYLQHSHVFCTSKRHKIPLFIAKSNTASYITRGSHALWPISPVHGLLPTTKLLRIGHYQPLSARYLRPLVLFFKATNDLTVIEKVIFHGKSKY